MKTTDLKLLTLYEELQLLKEFEDEENQLFNKLSKSTIAKAQVVADKNDCVNLTALKYRDMEAWKEQQKAVMDEFNALLLDGGAGGAAGKDGKAGGAGAAGAGGGIDNKNDLYPQLLNVFRNPEKRSKKKKAVGGCGCP